MAYEFEVERKDGYILLTASGVLESMDGLSLLTQSSKEESTRFDCRRFLIDERAGVKEVAPHDFIIFSERKMNEPGMWMRIFVLYFPEDISRLRWIETVFRTVPWSCPTPRPSSGSCLENRSECVATLSTKHQSGIRDDCFHAVQEGASRSPEEPWGMVKTRMKRRLSGMQSAVFFDNLHDKLRDVTGGRDVYGGQPFCTG